jgi:hypothetical protein
MADIQFFPATAAGTFTATVLDNNGNPATVLEAGLPISATGQITINAGQAITGTATVRAFADQLGGPFDQIIGTPATVNITGDGTFNWTINVPVGTFPEVAPPAPPPAASNLYRLAAHMTMVNSGGLGTETSSFEDLGTFMIS